MKNKYGLPENKLARIRVRDKKCVYCRVEIPDWADRKNGRDYATIEHLYPPGNDPTWVCFCCQSCNASHKSPLLEWFKSAYCLEKNINESTVAAPIKKFLKSGLKEYSQIWTDGPHHDFLLGNKWNSLQGKNDVEFIDKARLSADEKKIFAKIAEEIRYHEFTRWYKSRDSNVSQYFGYEYWLKKNIMYRRRISSK